MDTTSPQSLRHPFSTTTTCSWLAECVSIPTAPVAAFEISNTLDCYHRNQQYSITALTNNSGTIVERYSYSAYGQPTILDSSLSLLASSAYDNRYTYTGREWDASLKMYHYRARMYDPGLGRFAGRDPIGFRGSQWNLVEFVKSRPTWLLDPLGLQTEQHHNLAREIAELLDEVCGDTFESLGYVLPNGINSFIDEFTSPYLEDVHRFIHNRLDFNRNLLYFLRRGANCCDVLRSIDEYIGLINATVVREFWPNSNPLPRPEMYPYTRPNPWNASPNPSVLRTNDVFDQVLRDVCSIQCHERQPEWVPVPVPQPSPWPVVPTPTEEQVTCSWVAAGGVILYWCVSEGTRLFPARNAIPIL